MEQEITRLTNTIDEKDNKIKAITETKKKDLKTLQTSSDQKTLQIQNLNSEIDKNHETNSYSQKQIKTLTENLAVSQKELTNLPKQLQLTKDKLEKSHKEVQSTKDKLNDSQKQLQTTIDKSDTLADSLKQLQSTKDKLIDYQKQLHTYKESLKESHNQIQNLNKETKKNSENLLKYKSQLQQKSDALLQCETELKITKDNFLDSQNQLKTLKIHSDNVESKNLEKDQKLKLIDKEKDKKAATPQIQPQNTKDTLSSSQTHSKTLKDNPPDHFPQLTIDIYPTYSDKDRSPTNSHTKNFKNHVLRITKIGITSWKHGEGWASMANSRQFEYGQFKEVKSFKISCILCDYFLPGERIDRKGPIKDWRTSFKNGDKDRTFCDSTYFQPAFQPPLSTYFQLDLSK